MLAMTMRPHPVLAFAKTSLSLLKERDQRVRFAILHLVMLSAAKHPRTGFLALARNEQKKMLGMTKKCSEDRATSPCFGFRQNIPLLLQGEGRRKATG